jgi:hypothetical protein
LVRNAVASSTRDGRIKVLRVRGALNLHFHFNSLQPVLTQSQGNELTAVMPANFEANVLPMPNLEVESADDVTWVGVTERLALQLQELLNNVERTCRVKDLHRNTAKADTVTRVLHGLLVQLATEMNTTPGPLEVLGNSVSFFLFKLIDCVNRHFASRPRFERSWRLSRLSLLRNWESSNLNSEDPIWGMHASNVAFCNSLSCSLQTNMNDDATWTYSRCI